VRRLAIVLVAAGALLSLAPAAAATPAPEPQGGPTADLAPVDVIEVNGLLDEILVEAIDDAIERAAAEGSQAVILQLDSPGAVVSRSAVAALAGRIANAPVAVAVWVGPSGARVYGLPAQLLAAAEVTAMAPGTRIGRTGTPLDVPGVPIEFGEATEVLRSETLGFQEARELGALKLETSDIGVPVIVNMVYALDGVVVERLGVELDTVVETLDDDGLVRRDATTVRFFKLGAAGQLFHTVASPAVAYLLITIGLALLIFEFFTAGIGIAGMVGAISTVLGAYGLAALPARPWAVALLGFAMLAFAVDVQVGVPRLWTAIGLVSFVVASLWLFESVDGVTLRPSWITLGTGIIGIALTFIVGMPSMTRTRFATPTVGRERLVGALGTAVGPIDPEGTVRVGDGSWRARTNRATPIADGGAVRVVAIDGITLDVEPEEGGARDYRERRQR
jgi:membrane-bound serine protease (ClpP class)